MACQDRETLEQAADEYQAEVFELKRELGEAREALTPLLALQVKCIHCAHIKVLHIPWKDDEGKERWGDCQRHLCKCPGWPTPAALPQEPGDGR